MTAPESSPRIPILTWALLLGVTGFAAGFFGPIVLNPDANQGPLVGIFITGPLGALGGLVLGASFRLLPGTSGRDRQALGAACALLAIGTLYYCLPEPAARAYVIDAEVADCAPVVRGFDAALEGWNRAVARATWVTPPADWRERARRNLERDPGVLLTLRVARRSAIYEHRKPWDSGRMTAGPWVDVDALERYYASDAGGSCAAYLARGRALYAPFDDSPYDPNDWPPTDTTSFLRVLVLGPVPDAYRRLY